MTKMIANLDFVKERNVSAVYKSIVEAGAISRIQIARQNDLAPGSVTRITRQLIESGLISEVDQQDSERGRKATSLAPCRGAVQILAVRAGRTHIHVGLCDLSGGLLAKYSEPMVSLTQNELSEQLIRVLREFQQHNIHLIRCIAGVGITTPGLVNSSDGIISYMPHLSVDNLPLANQISEALNLPCYLSNNIAAMTLAEQQFGTSKGYENSLFIRVHNGVGLGLILDGRLYEGSGLAVGEVGHIQVDPLGEQCYCGNIGCLETVVSNAVIESRCRKLLQAGTYSTLSEGADILQICQAANEGDVLSQNLLKQAAKSLGQVIAQVVNLLRPGCIVLAGEVCQASSVIYPVIQQCLETQTVPVPGGHLPVLVNSELHSRSWFGGFSLVRRALLEKGLLLKLLDQIP